MPNANTISRYVGGNTPAQGANVMPSITLLTTVEQFVPVQSGGTAILFPQPTPQVLAATAAPSFGSGFDGFPFRVRATFKTTTAGTSTIIVNLYVNQVGTTVVAGNKVASITSQSLVTASSSGYLEATLIWDSIAKVLIGGQQGAFGTTVVTGNAALTTTGISVPALANLNFALSATNGSSVVGNIFACTEFLIDAV